MENDTMRRLHALLDGDSDAGGTTTASGTVTRVDDDDTVWVVLSGSDREIPTSATISPEVGDVVFVSFASGSATSSQSSTLQAATDIGLANVDAKAERARAAAESAESEASRAHDAADRAETYAVQANESANDAATAAATANASANSALANLSIVQDVAGTLQWIQDHCTFTATTDTEVDPSKVYFVLNQGQYEPVSNPTTAELSSYYELTNVEDSQADFVMTHLAVTNAGLWVLPNGLTGGGYKVLLANNAMRIYDGSGNYVADYSGSAVTFYDGLGNAAANVVAYFGRDGSQIGKTGESHVEIDYHSLRMIDSGGNTYMHVSDLRGADGLATVREAFVGDGSSTTFRISLSADSVTSVTVDGTAVSYTERSTIYVDLSQAPRNGAEILITYETDSNLAKAYTFGLRATNRLSGPMSFAEGRSIEASGLASHAEGSSTEASGAYSHAENCQTVASGRFSHAEGLDTRALGKGSHAEGYNFTTASGDYSHAEGSGTTSKGDYSHAEGELTKANGTCSHAQNHGTIASYYAQTAIGEYNDNKSTNLFEVGNGSSDSARSNAFEVTSEGNIVLPGTAYLTNVRHDIDQYTKIGDNVPSAQWYDGSELVYDKRGEMVYYSQMSRSASDVFYRSFIVRRLDASGNALTNGFYIQIKADGTRLIVLTHPQAWRDAMGIPADVDWTGLSLDNACEAYNTNTVPQYCKRSGVVNVIGAVKPKSQVAANGTLAIGTLPAGCRPKVQLSIICQGSGANVWQLCINTSGTMTAERYRTGSTNNVIPTSAWLIFNATFAAA